MIAHLPFEYLSELYLCCLGKLSYQGQEQEKERHFYILSELQTTDLLKHLVSLYAKQTHIYIWMKGSTEKQLDGTKEITNKITEKIPEEQFPRSQIPVSVSAS